MADVNTVTISTDEYFELREKACLASALSERLNRLEVMVNDTDRRLNMLGDEFYRFKIEGK